MSQKYGSSDSKYYLVGTTIDEFSEKAAYYMAELNIIHPFREVMVERFESLFVV